MIGASTSTHRTPSTLQHEFPRPRLPTPTPHYGADSHPSTSCRTSRQDHLDGDTNGKSKRPNSSSLAGLLPAPVLARLEADDTRTRQRIVALAVASLLLFLVVTRSDSVGSRLEESYSGVREGDWKVKDIWAKNNQVPQQLPNRFPGRANRDKNRQKVLNASKQAMKDGLYHFETDQLKDAPHPISTLIADAKKSWAKKIAKQSTTLDEAVKEYQRRNGRAPPKGFDKWWDYVSTHNVPLPDEYDSLHSNLRLFYAHSPSAISDRVRTTMTLSDTFVLVNTGGVVTVKRNFDPLKHPGGESRVAAQVALLEPIAEWLDDFQAVWSVHDTGRIYTSWSQRMELERAIAQGTYAEEEETDEQSGWSALVSSSTNLHRKDHPDAKSFITDHLPSMDIAMHPTHIEQHGTTAAKTPYTLNHLPLFSYSRHSLQTDILGIPYSHLINRTPSKWEDKLENKLLWRGGSTGGHYDKHVDWRQTHRFRLQTLTLSSNETSILSPSHGSLRVTRTSMKKASARYLDISLTGEPIQCDKSDGTCAEIAEEYTFVPRMTHEQAAKYKYLLDVDGNAWSARFKGLLSTGSVVLKSTIMPEWYHDRVQAWVHYVPVKLDYSDVFDIMAYFTGDMKGANGNDEQGREIGEAGKEWAKKYWRQEDMVAYTFRLYLEWARLYAEDRSKMDHS